MQILQSYFVLNGLANVCFANPLLYVVSKVARGQNENSGDAWRENGGA